jgi:hypothetical protein
MRLWIACFSLLLPTLGLACEYDRHTCEQDIVKLLSYRSEAIQGAFGDLSVAQPAQLQVKFVGTKDSQYPALRRSMRYDAQRKVLLVPLSMTSMTLPNPLRMAAYYWPFYAKDAARDAFPIIEAIDDALWTIFLEEAAHSSGQVWPNANCNSADPTRRLPCRMLLSAAARFVKIRADVLFNENRIDRIWPDDFASFEQRNYRYDHPAYADVERFGGILLMRPLIGEFGVPRVLAYVARTPLVVEDNSLRTSALRYQEQARNELRMRSEPAEHSGRPPITVAAFQSSPPRVHDELRDRAIHPLDDAAPHLAGREY